MGRGVLLGSRSFCHPGVSIKRISMLDPIRQEIVTNVDTIVVKVGTRVLTRDDGTLDTERVEAIGHELVRLVNDGRRPIGGYERGGGRRP